MAIIRNKRIRNFTTVPNELINDARLRWQDLGLLIYLLSKPDSWSVRVDVIAKERSLGRDGVYEILKRLREAGYAKLNRNADGSTEWIIYDEPHTENLNKTNPNQEKPDVASPNRENPDRENPDRENPDRENPDRENPDVLVNTNIEVNTDIKKRLNKEKINKKEKSDFVLPDWVDSYAWESFVDMRKKIKKPLTENAKKLAVDRLWKLKQEGNDPVEVLNQSTLNGYQGIFEVKKQSPPTKQNYKKYDPLNSIYGGDGFGNKRDTESRIIDIDGSVAYEEPKIQKLISH